MYQILTTPNPLRAGLVRSALEAAGIPVEVRNEFLAGALGELPPQECWLELWVADTDAPAADRVLDAMARAGEDKSTWRCPACDELLEPQFGQCWQCGALAP